MQKSDPDVGAPESDFAPRGRMLTTGQDCDPQRILGAYDLCEVRMNSGSSREPGTLDARTRRTVR